MKRIIKGTEPPCLLQYRQIEGATYDNYRPKDPLKKSLLIEQGSICCYCMGRLSESTMEIEHFKPQAQDKYPELQLDYRNLLASCNGNRGQPQHLQHCNPRKGDQEITLNPADPHKNCETFIKYRSNGEIYSDDTTIDQELNETLNLNYQTLVRNRRMVIKTVIDELNRRFPGKTWPEEFLSKKISQWQNKNSKGQYNEYCQVVIYYLSKRV